MATIAHLALGTPDVVKTANFYKEVFRLPEMVRTHEPGAGDSPSDDMVRRLYLSDGHMNLTICKVPTVGMYHFGFVVDSVDETLARWRATGVPQVIVQQRPTTGARNFETKTRGPEGAVIDLAETGLSGWPVHPTGGGASKIQHVALGTPNVVKTANFYKEVFGLQETERKYEAGAGANPPDDMVRRLYLWDGQVNLTICKVPTLGMYHFGFVVNNVDETRKRLEANGARIVLAHPRPVTREGHFEDKYRGPQGVAIDVASTEQGWGP